MTLAEFRSRVARVTGMSSTVSADTALIDAWVYEAVVQFLRETKIDLRRATTSVTAGQEDYTLDDDILAMQAVYYVPTNTNEQSYLLRPVTAERMFQMRLLPEDDTTAPQFFALAGAHLLLLHPAPASSADALKMLYVPRPSVMAATSDSPSATAYGNIPAEYHPVLESYVKWKAAEAEEHKASDNGMSFRAEWETGVSRARTEVMRKAGMVIAPVTLGRPGRAAASPGVDTGY